MDKDAGVKLGAAEAFDPARDQRLERLSARIVALECDPASRLDLENQARDRLHDVICDRQVPTSGASNDAEKPQIDLTELHKRQFLSEQYLCLTESGRFAGFFGPSERAKNRIRELEEELGIGVPEPEKSEQ